MRVVLLLLLLPLAAQAAVGAGGHVLGVDISSTLLGLARSRVTDPNVQIEHADAQTFAFSQDRDVVLSRFGVMFFEDTTAAFRNISKALKPGGRFALAAWAHAKDNPYFMRAAQAVRATLGEMPKTDRTLPGPFAFEDADRVRPMLEQAGLKDIVIEAVPLTLTAKVPLEQLAKQLLAIGPAAAGLRHFEATETERDALQVSLQEHYAEFARPEGIQIPAMIHMITTRI